MSAPRIIVGSGDFDAQAKRAMAMIMSQVLPALARMPLPTVNIPTLKRRESGPFNKTQEAARRRRQLQRAREKREA